MPNSCKFIFKSFSIAFLLSVVSCASLNQQFSGEKYLGKFTLIQDKNNSNFSVAIFPSSSNVIIQVKKPLLGNVLNITFDKFKAVSIIPKLNDNNTALINSINPKLYFNIISSCIKSNKSKKDFSILEDNRLSVNCSYMKNGSSKIIIKEADNFYISGVITNYE
jgi:hypothetical protein|tara:strand:+ start:2138 stop:2629 length:492 start_codon:yes stop_codon:yes gene_type:complete